MLDIQSLKHAYMRNPLFIPLAHTLINFKSPLLVDFDDTLLGMTANQPIPFWYVTGATRFQLVHAQLRDAGVEERRVFF